MPTTYGMAKLSSKGQLIVPAAVRARMGLGAGDTVLFIEDNGRVVLMKPDDVEIQLRNSFPVHRAETVAGGAFVPASWDDPADDVYDDLG